MSVSLYVCLSLFVLSLCLYVFMLSVCIYVSLSALLNLFLPPSVLPSSSVVLNKVIWRRTSFTSPRFRSARTLFFPSLFPALSLFACLHRVTHLVSLFSFSVAGHVLHRRIMWSLMMEDLLFSPLLGKSPIPLIFLTLLYSRWEWTIWKERNQLPDYFENLKWCLSPGIVEIGNVPVRFSRLHRICRI